MTIVRRRIRAAAKEEDLTMTQAHDLQQKRISLQKRINGFRELQRVYMPVVEMKLKEADDGDNQRDVEDVKLWLPSELDLTLREHGCHEGVASMEEELREGQCRDALDKIRNLQRAKMHFIHFRNTNTRGQRPATRAQNLINSISSKIHLATSRYRDARLALFHLRGPGKWEEELRVLNDEDIRSPNSSVFDIEDPDDMFGPDGRLKSKKQREEIERNKQLGEGRKTLSWIWLNVVGKEDDDDELNEGELSCFSFSM
jgi:hypothetical protein